MPNVIARFPTGKAIAYFSLCFALVALTFIATIYAAFGTDFLRTHGMGWLLFFVIGWFAGVFLLALLFALLNQIVFARFCAVWSDEASIIYLNRHFMAVRKDKVQSISLGTFGRFNSPAIVLHLRDGSTKAIPTMGLSETAVVVLDRLRKLVTE